MSEEISTPSGPSGKVLQAPRGTSDRGLMYQHGMRESRQGVRHPYTAVIKGFVPSFAPAVNEQRRARRDLERSLGVTSSRQRRRLRSVLDKWTATPELREAVGTALREYLAKVGR